MSYQESEYWLSRRTPEELAVLEQFVKDHGVSLKETAHAIWHVRDVRGWDLNPQARFLVRKNGAEEKRKVVVALASENGAVIKDRFYPFVTRITVEERRLGEELCEEYCFKWPFRSQGED